MASKEKSSKRFRNAGAGRARAETRNMKINTTKRSRGGTSQHERPATGLAPHEMYFTCTAEVVLAMSRAGAADTYLLRVGLVAPQPPVGVVTGCKTGVLGLLKDPVVASRSLSRPLLSLDSRSRHSSRPSRACPRSASSRLALKGTWCQQPSVATSHTPVHASLHLAAGTHTEHSVDGLRGAAPRPPHHTPQCAAAVMRM